MAKTVPPSAEHHEAFSLPFFTSTMLLTLAALLGALRLLFPGIWVEQLLAPVGKGIAAFVLVTLVNCFIEFFFHRYLLHTSAVPLISRLYRQHTLHHALTRIARKPMRDGGGILFIENKFPIIEEEQGEASFFPWYTLAVFAGVLSPFLALLQWVLPSFPWFFGGFAALASSLALYEIFHAINHWSLEQWLPLIEHPRWGKLWHRAYAFHLRHHAVIDCNESISGFFGLPLADWTFGTCVIPKTIYADGEEWSPEKFTSPRPRWPVRSLDAWADAAMRRRRSDAAAGEPGTEVPAAAAGRIYTRGEEIATWVTHGLGLVLSIVSLTLLIVFSSRRGDAWHVVSFTVFGLTLLTMYLASALYHAWRSPGPRRVLPKLNHVAIFLLIAGTYTPFLLTSLRGPRGWTLFGIIWGLCGAGVAFQIFLRHRSRMLSTLAYLFVGWALVVALKPMLSTVPHGGLWLLLAGALSYGVGVAFHRWNSLRYHYAFWRGFVLGGSTCHVLAVLLFLLPRA